MKKLVVLAAFVALGSSAFAAPGGKSVSAKPDVFKSAFKADPANAGKPANAFGKERAATYGGGGNRQNVSKS